MRAGGRYFEPGARPGVALNFVDHEFFSTLDIRLPRGRSFGDDVGPGTAPVALINETAARELFPDGDPLGRPFAATAEVTPDGTTAEIIGVVADVLYGPPEQGVMAEAYFSHWHMPQIDPAIIVRTRGEPLGLAGAMRRELAALDPDLPIFDVTTVDDLGAAQVNDTRVVMAFLGAFAAVAVLLAATGVWGIVAYAVSQRRRELGVRMALGARSEQLVARVLRQGLAGVLAGLGVGLVAALVLSRLLESLLYEVGTTQPSAFVAGGGLVLVVALLAAYVPARRATRVDPVESLRAE